MVSSGGSPTPPRARCASIRSTPLDRVAPPWLSLWLSAVSRPAGTPRGSCQCPGRRAATVPPSFSAKAVSHRASAIPSAPQRGPVGTAIGRHGGGTPPDSGTSGARRPLETALADVGRREANTGRMLPTTLSPARAGDAWAPLVARNNMSHAVLDAAIVVEPRISGTPNARSRRSRNSTTRSTRRNPDRPPAWRLSSRRTAEPQRSRSGDPSRARRPPLRHEGLQQRLVT